MTIAKRIAELEAEQSKRRVTLARLMAEYHGAEAELDSLRVGVALTDELAALPRTEAIVNVLRSAKSPLTPTEITSRLVHAGRNDDRRSVTATLDYLMKQEQVLRPAKGRYLAV